MNKRYTIEFKEICEEPKKKKEPSKSNDYTFLLLIFAAIVGVILSPDLINVTDYIPKDKYENTNRF